MSLNYVIDGRRRRLRRFIRAAARRPTRSFPLRLPHRVQLETKCSGIRNRESCLFHRFRQRCLDPFIVCSSSRPSSPLGQLQFFPFILLAEGRHKVLAAIGARLLLPFRFWRRGLLAIPVAHFAPVVAPNPVPVATGRWRYHQVTHTSSLNFNWVTDFSPLESQLNWSWSWSSDRTAGTGLSQSDQVRSAVEAQWLKRPSARDANLLTQFPLIKLWFSTGLKQACWDCWAALFTVYE